MPLRLPLTTGSMLVLLGLLLLVSTSSSLSPLGVREVFLSDLWHYVTTRKLRPGCIGRFFGGGGSLFFFFRNLGITDSRACRGKLLAPAG